MTCDGRSLCRRFRRKFHRRRREDGPSYLARATGRGRRLNRHNLRSGWQAVRGHSRRIHAFCFCSPLVLRLASTSRRQNILEPARLRMNHHPCRLPDAQDDSAHYLRTDIHEVHSWRNLSRLDFVWKVLLGAFFSDIGPPRELTRLKKSTFWLCLVETPIAPGRD